VRGSHELIPNQERFVPSSRSPPGAMPPGRQRSHRFLSPLPLAAMGIVLGLALVRAGSSVASPPDLQGRTLVEAAPSILATFAEGPTGTSADGETLHPEVHALQLQLDGILASTGNRGGRWAVLAVSLDRGDTLLSRNAQDLMVPASNIKIFTTAAALHHLGPGFRYHTFVLADGPQRGSVLEGDIVLYGTGDPTLSQRFFPSETAPMDSLAQKVLERGILEIRGNLVIDGSFFHGPDLHPDWDPRDLNDAFAAPVASIGFNENLVTVKVNPGSSVGSMASAHAEPTGSGLPVRNLARTAPAGTRSRLWLLRDTPWDSIGIEGEIPLRSLGIWRSLPVPDPLLFTGLQLKRALESQGIRVGGRVVVNRDPHASRLGGPSDPGVVDGIPAPRILGTLTSPPLLEILRVVNKRSNNFFAEAVVKTLGRTVLGDGSYAGGQRVVEEFLVRQVGVDRENIRIRDGSGLSPDNAASTGALVQVLAFMSDSPGWEDFWGTLPEAGVRGEMRRMLRTPAAGNLRAKTGTMKGVSALSGMVRTQAGERILFSFISNGVASEDRAKDAEDKVAIRLASLTRPPS